MSSPPPSSPTELHWPPKSRRQVPSPPVFPSIFPCLTMARRQSPAQHNPQNWRTMKSAYIYPIKPTRLVDRVFRRTVDIVVGSILLLFTAPLWLAAAIAVRLESEGNPFFPQKRVGLGGKPFHILKLRGMYRDA